MTPLLWIISAVAVCVAVFGFLEVRRELETAAQGRREDLARRWRAFVVSQYDALWDAAETTNPNDPVSRLCYGVARREWGRLVLSDDKPFWDQVHACLSNPITRPYYTHPNERTSEDAAQVDANPDVLMSAGADGCRFALEARSAANFAALAGFAAVASAQPTPR